MSRPQQMPDWIEATEEFMLNLCEQLQSATGDSLLEALGIARYIVAVPNSCSEPLRRHLARCLEQDMDVFRSLGVPEQKLTRFAQLLDNQMSSVQEMNLMGKKVIFVKNLSKVTELSMQGAIHDEIEAMRQECRNGDDEERFMKQMIRSSEERFGGIPLKAVLWDFEVFAQRNLHGDTPFYRLLEADSHEYSMTPDEYLLGPLVSPQEIFVNTAHSLKARLRNTNLFQQEEARSKWKLPSPTKSRLVIHVDEDDNDVVMEDDDPLEEY